MSLITPNINISRSGLNRIPRVAVVDDFDTKQVDIDGDGSPCISHGEAVCTLLRSYIPNVEIIPIKILPGEKVITSQLVALIDLQDSQPIDAINISSSNDVYIGILKSLIDNLNVDNLLEDRDKILDVIQTLSDKNITRAIALLEQLGGNQIPIYISGSNNIQFFNALTLARNVTLVTSTDKKGDETYYSSSHNNSRKARGAYNIYPIKDGFSFVPDGEMIFENDVISGGSPIVEKFVGKPITEFEATMEETNQLMYLGVGANPNLNGKLFPSTELLPKLFRKPGKEREFFTADMQFRFNADDNGLITYCPDNSSNTGAVSSLEGDSYATPTLLALDLIKNLSSV